MAQATKAEKGLKSAKEQLRRAAAKSAAKPKTQDIQSKPLFDQGASVAKQVCRFDLTALKPDDLDFTRPFVISAGSWTPDALSSVKTDLDSFKVSMDIGRKETPHIRASKALEHHDPAAFDIHAKVEALFKDSGALVTCLAANSSLSKQVVPTLFGIDVGYDKVSMEAAGLACFRLTVEGTRSVVMTSSQQLIGFMHRKGVSGVIPTGRQANFLRCMSASVIQDYVQECELFASTLHAGDLLYTPYGFTQGELVQTLTYGIRIPGIVKHDKDATAVVAVKRRLQEAEATVKNPPNEAAKGKAMLEVDLLRELSTLAGMNNVAAGAAP